MAEKINAIQAYTPRIVMKQKINTDELVAWMTRKSKWKKGMIISLFYLFQDALIFYLNNGYYLKMEGIGTFSPTITKEGLLNVGFLPDIEIKDNLNKTGNFNGKIKNKKMIGKTLKDLVKRWNKEHPDDPIKE